MDISCTSAAYHSSYQPYKSHVGITPLSLFVSFFLPSFSFFSFDFLGSLIMVDIDNGNDIHFTLGAVLIGSIVAVL